MRNEEKRYLEQWIYIDEAYKSLLKKRYKESVVLLEKNILQNINNPYPFLLLSVAYLLTDNFLQAEATIEKIRKIDDEYLPFLELEAFIILKAVNTREESLLKYLDLEYLYPKNNRYKKIISKIRKADNFKVYQKKLKLFDCLDLPAPDKRIVKEAKKHRKGQYKKPIDFDYVYSYKKNKKSNLVNKELKKRKKLKLKYVLLLIILLIGFADYKYKFITNQVREIINKTQIFAKLHQEEDNLLTINNKNYSIIDKIVRSKKEIYYYSEKKLKQDFKIAQIFIKQKKYDEAMVIINKIYHSNANIRVKEKVNFLRKFILNVKERKPGKLSYKELVKQPFLYQGVLVKWKGKISNIKITKNRSKFTMLVNYKDKDRFDGTVDVLIDKKIEQYQNGDMVNVSAIFINTGKSSKKYYLHAYELEYIEI